MFLFALCLAIGTTATAQTERGGMGNNAAYNKIKSALVEAGIPLDAMQERNLLQLMTKEGNARREAVRDAGGDRAAARTKMQAMRADTAEKMKEILSPDQFAVVERTRPQGGKGKGMGMPKNDKSKISAPSKEGKGTSVSTPTRGKTMKDRPTKAAPKADRTMPGKVQMKDKAQTQSSKNKYPSKEGKVTARPNGKGKIGKMGAMKQRGMERFNKMKDALAAAGVPLTQMQEGKLKSITKDEFQAISKLKKEGGNSAIQGEIKKLRKSYGKKIKAVLSSKQAKVVKKLRKNIRG